MTEGVSRQIFLFTVSFNLGNKLKVEKNFLSWLKTSKNIALLITNTITVNEKSCFYFAFCQIYCKSTTAFSIKKILGKFSPYFAEFYKKWKLSEIAKFISVKHRMKDPYVTLLTGQILCYWKIYGWRHVWFHKAFQIKDNIRWVILNCMFHYWTYCSTFTVLPRGIVFFVMY